jgi:hypothetical protein
MNKPKIYSLVLENKDTSFLSIQVSHSLEEAYLLAKLEFEKLNINKPRFHGKMEGAKIGMFTTRLLEEIVMIDNALHGINGSIEIEEEHLKEMEEIIKSIETDKVVEKPPTKEQVKNPVTEKNQLMKQVIESKDIEIFNKFKGRFSRAEREYILAEFKKQTK